MNPKRPAAVLFLAILSAGNLPAAAMPLGDSQDAQRRCIDLYHQAQGEAQARLTAIGGDYAKGWSTPGMHYPTLSATVLRPFKDTAESAIRQSCAGDARAATMDRLKGAMETAGRYDRPVAALSAR